MGPVIPQLKMAAVNQASKPKWSDFDESSPRLTPRGTHTAVRTSQLSPRLAQLVAKQLFMSADEEAENRQNTGSFSEVTLPRKGSSGDYMLTPPPAVLRKRLEAAAKEKENAPSRLAAPKAGGYALTPPPAVIRRRLEQSKADSRNDVSSGPSSEKSRVSGGEPDEGSVRRKKVRASLARYQLFEQQEGLQSEVEKHQRTAACLKAQNIFLETELKRWRNPSPNPPSEDSEVTRLQADLAKVVAEREALRVELESRDMSPAPTTNTPLKTLVHPPIVLDSRIPPPTNRTHRRPRASLLEFEIMEAQTLMEVREEELNTLSRDLVSVTDQRNRLFAVIAKALQGDTPAEEISVEDVERFLDAMFAERDALRARVDQLERWLECSPQHPAATGPIRSPRYPPGTGEEIDLEKEIEDEIQEELDRARISVGGEGPWAIWAASPGSEATPTKHS